MPMGGYLLRRIGLMGLTLTVTSVLVFIIIQLPPGDYLTTYIEELRAQGEMVPPERIAYMRAQYGLDQPLVLQYLTWAGGLLTGNLGYSFEHSVPVASLIGDVFVLTILVNAATVLFVYMVAFPIGLYSATHRYSWSDYGLTFLGFLGLATPNFLLALILLYLSNRWFGTTIGGLMDPAYLNQPWSVAKALSVLEHLWVPVVVIGTAGTAAMIRRLRANLLDELNRPYVTTARAKGVPPTRLLLTYPLRMALNPFVADIGNLLPQLVSGSVIVSAVMSLPTTGPLLLRALAAQDYYVAGAMLMFLALLTVAGQLLSDVLLAVLDPRIRLGGGARR